MTECMEPLWIAIFATLMFIAGTSSSQVVIEIKPECHSCLNTWIWDTFNVNAQTGWTLKPGTAATSDKPGTPPLYSACDDLSSSDPQPNNWLRSDLITVNEAKRIDITFEYRIQDCENRPFCVNVFDLYVNQSNQLIEDASQYPNPLNNTAAYENVAGIGQPINSRSVQEINVLVKGKYVLLAFHNYGACSNLYSVKVTYNVCPDETLSDSLVSLPKTVAPANDSESIEGNCLENTINEQGSLYVHCDSNGKWNTSGLEGRCICKENMQNAGGKCEACPDGKYNDQKGLNCTVLPSAPRNAQITFGNQSTVVISWLPPAITGDRTNVSYDVECNRPCDNDDDNTCVDETCGSDVTYIPYKEDFNLAEVMITNLSTFVNYTFKIYATNRVSEVAKRRHGVEGNFATITVRTNGSIPGKPEVSVEHPKSVVIVSWILKQKNGIIRDYHVSYIREDDSSDSKVLTTQEMEQRFKDLMPGKTYTFQVFAVNEFGRGPTGVKTFTLRKDNSKLMQIIAIAAGGGGLLLFLIIIVVIIFYRRRKGRMSVEKAYMRSIQRGTDLQSINQRRYIDPGNYRDLMELLSEFTMELERSDTKLEGLIGQGEFADVYKGILKTREGKQVVAVKVLRPGSSEKNQKDFLSEASIVSQFNHPNVIKLIGVVTQSRPMMILTEFLESGSLDHFLKARDGQLTNLQLIGMARGVACGMVYLSDMNFIHRDLAARNVLVGENMLCKVSDFGLSRELADDSEEQAEYHTQGGKIPVRWTAPEALQHRTFSTASDVWSFGILLWEIMSFSERPYWDWDNLDVMKRVETGYRLPPPQGCPNVIHCLMMECWDKDKSKRPTFSEIVSRFDELIRSPEVLGDILSPLTAETVAVDFPENQSVDDWLKYINMEKYSETFQTANIDDLNKVTQLQDNDLKEMGISLIGHRHKMNKSIKTMRSKFHNKGMEDVDDDHVDNAERR